DTPLPAVPEVASDSPALAVGARAVESYRGDTARALADIKQHAHDGWRTLLVFEGHGPAQRAVEVLADAAIGASLLPTVGTELAPGVVAVTTGMLGGGFVAPELKLAVLTESDLTGSRGVSTKDMRRMPSRRRNAVDPLQLQPGDYVVHEQ